MAKNDLMQDSPNAITADKALSSKAWLANGVELLFQRLGLNKHGKPFDVVIVGSGYGGSIAAAELSKARDLGLSICLLERGREFLPGSFPNSTDEAPTEFRMSAGGKPKGNLEGLYDLRLNKDLNIMQANGLGGGSLINAGVMERAKNHVFEDPRWPTEINAGSLKPYYDKAELLLGSKNRDAAGKIEDNTIFLHPDFRTSELGPAKYQSLKTLAAGAANGKTTNTLDSEFKNANITVNMHQGKKTSAGVALNACNLCGDCASGCNNNAKISLDKNLLIEAARNGVEIFTGATVLSLKQKKTENWQLELVYTDAKLRHRQSKTTLSLETSNIILSAGALGSTEILKRSQSMQLRFSHRLGKQFSSNGDMLAVGFEQNQLAKAIADPNVAHSKRGIGPTITGMIDSRGDADPRQRMVIQEMAVPAPAAHFFSQLFATVNTAQTLCDSDTSAHHYNEKFSDPAALKQKSLDYTSLYAVMGDDGADGSLVFESAGYQNYEGTIQVHWPALKEHSLYDRQVDRLISLSGINSKPSNHDCLGGRVLPNPVWQLLKPEHMNMMKLDRGAPLTVHPLGGCPMGESEKDGVTNHLGQVFKPNNSKHSTNVYHGLSVLDGATIPSALGINPALTISAISLRAIQQQIRLKYVIGSNALASSKVVKARSEAAHAISENTLKVPTIRSLKQLEALATDAQNDTEIQITERLVGFSRLENNAGKLQDVVIELTLWSKPIRIKSLLRDDIGEHPKKSYIVIDDNQRDPVSRQPLSKVRIYYRHHWELIRSGKKKVDKHEVELDHAAKFIGQINGTIEMFARAESYPMSRIVESGWGWLMNRGLRDIYQLRRPKFWEKPAKILAKENFRKGRLMARFINLLRTLSKAGEIRTLNYQLKVTRSLKTLDFSYFGPDQNVAEPQLEKRIVGVKKLTYQRRANPWIQLTDVSLRQLPSNADTATTGQLKNITNSDDNRRVAKKQRALADRGNTLTLDKDYLTKAGIPLIRITQQQNQVKALIDLSSFGAYMTRMLLGLHFYSFKAPDTPRPRKATRFAGKIRGLPMPSVQRIVVGNIPDDRISTLVKGQAVEIIITHYAHPLASKLPVMMLHGYSGSSTFFAHATTPNSLAKFMHDEQRDVWLIDLRTSAALASARYPWTFETVSGIDIPRAVGYIYDYYKGQFKLDVVTHCMGSVMLGMSILRADDHLDDDAGQFFKDRINRIVFSQATPTLVFTEDNNFRSFAVSYLREMVPDDYQFQLKDGEKASQLLDRILYTLPYPQQEYDLVNAPMRPSQRAEFARTRHRVDAFFSRTFELANLSTETLNHIDDFFGPIHVDTIIQASRFAIHNVATNTHGNNSYVSRERLQNFWAGIPTMSFHTRNNGLIDFSTGERTKRIFEEAGLAYQSIVINDESYGHQDSIIGMRAHIDVFPHISAFLNASETKHPLDDSESATEVRAEHLNWVVEAPAYGPIIIDQNNPSQGNNACKIMLGSSASRASRAYCIFVPIVFDNNILRLAGADWSQQTQILNRYIAQSLELENTSSKQRESRWHIVTLPNSMLLNPNHNISVESLSKEKYGLATLMIYQDLVELETSFVIATAEPQAIDSGSDQDRGTDSIGNVNRPINKSIELRSRISQVIHNFIKSNRNVRHEFEKSVIEYPGHLNSQKSSVSFAVGSCQYPAGILDKQVAYRSYQHLNQLLESRQTRKPEFVALLGDQIYADATAGFLDPSNKFDQFVMPYYRLYENIHVRSVLRKIPLYAMLDDHELSDNWEPVTNNLSQQHALDDTLDIGVKSFLTFQRGQIDYKKDNKSQGSRPPLWYSFERNGVDFFMCDTRTERSARTASNILQANTTIMHASQQTALEQWLIDSDKHQAKFILSSSIVLPRHRLKHASQNSAANCIRSDGWDGYPVSLYKMLAMVVDQNIRQLVFVSGDEHIGCYAEIQIVNLNTGKTVDASSIHCPGLYTPLPFANSRVDDFEGSSKGSSEGSSEGKPDASNGAQSPQSQDRHISQFTFEQSNMRYQCTVNARFTMTDNSISLGPVKVELCEGFLIVKTFK